VAEETMVSPRGGAECVAAREDVLEGYAAPYDPARPQVNLAETTKQLIKETRQPLPPQPSRPPRSDDESERHGTRTLFLGVAPQAGRRHVPVTEQRTQLDFAHARQWRVDEGSPDATVMRVVLDQLHTHKIASLSAAFEPAEARRIASKLEWHDPPKHGSGLNLAEMELRVLQPQCLDRRSPDDATLRRAMAAWEHQRNTEHATIAWRFSISDARHKRKRLYPSLPS
jgi:hypothetical protein